MVHSGESRILPIPQNFFPVVASSLASFGPSSAWSKHTKDEDNLRRNDANETVDDTLDGYKAAGSPDTSWSVSPCKS